MKEFINFAKDGAGSSGPAKPVIDAADAVAETLAAQQRLLEELQLKVALDEAKQKGLKVLSGSGSLIQALAAYGEALGAQVEVTVDPDTRAQILNFTIKRSDIAGASKDQAAQ